MIVKINIILILIILLECFLQFLLSHNYFNFVISGLNFIVLFLITKSYLKKQKRYPMLYVAILIFLTNSYVLDFDMNFIILNLIFTYHYLLLGMNWNDYDSFNQKPLIKSGIDIGINRYSICFISTLVTVYFAMSGKLTINKPLLFDCIAFLLIGLNLVLLLISNMFIRFKTIQNSINLFFSSTILAILILFISGPYVISTFTPNLVSNAIQDKKEMNPEPAVRPNHENRGSRDVAGYSDNLHLTKRNNISKSHSVEAFLMCSDSDKAFLKPGKIYLRGAAFDTYNSNKWSNYYDKSRWLEDGVDNSPDGVIRLQDPKIDLKKIHTITHSVYLLNGEHGNILALSNITDIYMDKVLAEENDTYYLPTKTGNQVKYKVTGGYISYEDIDKKNLVVGRKNSKKLQTILGDVCARIKGTTESLFKPELSDIDKIESILYFFRQNFRYSLSTVNDQDLDPLENFFYHEKKGHCELYATSLAIMLRSAGIPSRVCVGYCGGEFKKNLDAYVFYADEAHAWVEIYFEDYGWVVIDSTPATSQSAHTEENKENAEIDFNADKFSEFGPNEDKIQKSKIAKGILGIIEALLYSASKNPMLMINLILLTYPISFFLIFGIFQIFKFKKRKGKDEAFSNPDFIKEIYKIFGKKPKNLTFVEYLDKLKEQQAIKDELDEIMDYYYSFSYGKTSRIENLEKKIILELIQIQKQVQIKKQNNKSQRIPSK